MKALSQEKALSSREVAEISSKQHKHVLAAIRKMEESWVKLGQPHFSPSIYFDSQGKKQSQYNLSKTECLYIATKFNDEARGKLVLRWEELEKDKTPQTFADALQLAADQAKQIELQGAKVQSLEEALDTSEQWISIIRAAKQCEVHETYFSWRTLKKYSIANGIEMKTAPCPRFGTKKLYHISVFKNCYNEVTKAL